MPQPIDLGKLRFSYNGVFDNGKLYEVNDVVKYGGSAYVYTNNISASGNVPTNATYWAKMVDGVQYEDDWSASASYQVNDVVKYGPQTYIALTDNTNTDPSLNANVWDVFTGGMQFVGVWASASLYYPKQVVRLGGSTYIAQLRHTSGSSFLVDHQAGKWTPFTSGFEYLGLWTANTPYLPGDIVNDGVSAFLAIGEFTSGENFETEKLDTSKWELFVQGADYLPSQLGQAGKILTTDGENPLWVRDVELGETVILEKLFVGETAQTFEASAALTSPIAIFGLNSGEDPYAQVSFQNANPEASTDVIVYGDTGDDTSGWMDMGITGSEFEQSEFGITGPDNGYIFFEAPESTTGTGNMVIATGGNGSENAIVIAAGGFETGRSQMIILPDNRVHIEIATESTNPTNGALTVLGGAGVQGNLNVLGNMGIEGNINLQGNITIGGGQFVTENLSSSDPLLFVGNENPGNDYDLGFMAEQKLPSASARALFGMQRMTASAVLLETKQYGGNFVEVTQGSPSNTCTITLDVIHALAVGDFVEVNGLADTNLNGVFQIIAKTDTTISFATNVAPFSLLSDASTVQYYMFPDARTMVVGDVVTITGASAAFNGSRKLKTVNAKQITFAKPTGIAASATLADNYITLATATRTTRSIFSGLVKDHNNNQWYLMTGLEDKPLNDIDMDEVICDVLNVGSLIAKYGVNVFATEADRNVNIPSPSHGTMVYVQEKKAQQYYSSQNRWESIEFDSFVSPLLLMGV
jgi:DNA/RNA endonuclease YhcR with UshA esterase domain